MINKFYQLQIKKDTQKYDSKNIKTKYQVNKMTIVFTSELVVFFEASNRFMHSSRQTNAMLARPADVVTEAVEDATNDYSKLRWALKRGEAKRNCRHMRELQRSPHQVLAGLPSRP